MRENPEMAEVYESFAFIGQTAFQMVKSVNRILQEVDEPSCRQLIISGGIKSYLDGYHLVELSQLPAVYGMASSVLKHATDDYQDLKAYIENQLKAYRLAQHYLKINPAYDEA